MEANANHQGTNTPDAIPGHINTGKGALDTDRLGESTAPSQRDCH